MIKQITDHNMVIICCLGGPLNSSFILCSRIHTTIPTKKKKQAVTIHIKGVNGCRKDQPPELIFLKGATTTSPDAAYGCVKSTILVRFVTIAMSPIAPSRTCNAKLKELAKLKSVSTHRVSGLLGITYTSGY
jgi:hypothetical protein